MISMPLGPSGTAAKVPGSLVVEITPGKRRSGIHVDGLSAYRRSAAVRFAPRVRPLSLSVSAPAGIPSPWGTSDGADGQDQTLNN